jgi:hypothetical protein
MIIDAAVTLQALVSVLIFVYLHMTYVSGMAHTNCLSLAIAEGIQSQGGLHAVDVVDIRVSFL